MKQIRHKARPRTSGGQDDALCLGRESTKSCQNPPHPRSGSRQSQMSQKITTTYQGRPPQMLAAFLRKAAPSDNVGNQKHTWSTRTPPGVYLLRCALSPRVLKWRLHFGIWVGGLISGASSIFQFYKARRRTPLILEPNLKEVLLNPGQD